jgi:hypothetical protein
MEVCHDALDWRWMGLELLTTRHPADERTLLHLAASLNNAVGVRELTAIWMNPLLRDQEGRLAVELTTDASIRAALLEYTQQPPRREVIRWYGPYLMQRVRMFLLCLQRWQTTSSRCLPRAVVHQIIGHV